MRPVREEDVVLPPVKRSRGFHMGIRKHPAAFVGQRFGCKVVIKLLPLAHARSDERVRVKCACGRIADVYVFNIRKAPEACKCRPGARAGLR